MPTIERTALVTHSAEQMFDLVNDVARYPEFLPWCESSEVKQQTPEQLIATLSLAKAGISYEFTTANKLQRPHSMQMRLVEGVFSQFSGDWRFTVLSDRAAKVELKISFEFSQGLMALAMNKVFEQIAGTLVDAFVQRANAIYRSDK